MIIFPEETLQFMLRRTIDRITYLKVLIDQLDKANWNNILVLQNYEIEIVRLEGLQLRLQQIPTFKDLNKKNRWFGYCQRLGEEITIWTDKEIIQRINTEYKLYLNNLVPQEEVESFFEMIMSDAKHPPSNIETDR
jgi:hypothetical protein